jgi:hypothetical protein
MKLVPTFAFALVATTVLFGCTTKIDKTKVEGSIREETAKKEWPVKTITCPDGIVAKAGGAFDCAIDMDDGQKVTAKVQIVDDKGAIKWSASGVIVTKKLAETLKGELQKNAKIEAQVACPSKKVLVLSGKGETLACTAEHDGKKSDLEVTLEPSGSMAWKLKAADGAEEAKVVAHEPEAAE